MQSSQRTVLMYANIDVSAMVACIVLGFDIVLTIQAVSKVYKIICQLLIWTLPMLRVVAVYAHLSVSVTSQP